MAEGKQITATPLMCAVYILYRAVKDISKLLRVVKEVVLAISGIDKRFVAIEKKKTDVFLLSLNVLNEMKLN